MSFPETVSDSLGRNTLVVQTQSFVSCPGGWFQTILQVKKPVVEVPTSKRMLEAVDGREINIKLSGNSFGGHSCVV